MARYRFPADRSAFVYGQDFAPILTPPRTALVLYTDEAMTLLADVRDLGGGALPNSTVYVEQGLVPEFLGPDGVTRVWAARAGTTAYPLDAQALDVLAHGAGGGGSPSFVFTQSIAQSVWTVAHNLGEYPAAVSIFSADWALQFDEFSVRHTDVNNLLISMDTPTAGKAVIR